MERLEWLYVVLLLLITAIMPGNSVPVSGYDARFIHIDGNILADNAVCNPIGMNCIDWVVKQSEGNLVGIIDGIGNADKSILSPGSILSEGSTLAKEDMTRVYVSNNTKYLYVGEERRANSGSSSWHLLFTRLEPTYEYGKEVVFHLSNEDIEIQVCFPKGGDPTGKSITVRQVKGLTEVLSVPATSLWTTGNWEVNPGAAAAFEINTTVCQSLNGAIDSKGKITPTYDLGCFAEAAISLEALNINPCGAEAYATVVTRSSCSLTSSLKDIAEPILYHFGGPVLDAIEYTADCSNNVCLSVKGTGGTPPYRFQWYDGDKLIRDVTIDGAAPVVDSICSTLTPGTHTIKVVLTDAVGCFTEKQTGSFIVYHPLVVTVSGSANCRGVTTWTAAPSGGYGAYKYQWSVDGQVVSSQSAATFQYGPVADCSQHEVCVLVTDARGCNAKACRKITQAVTTTIQ